MSKLQSVEKDMPGVSVARLPPLSRRDCLFRRVQDEQDGEGARGAQALRRNPAGNQRGPPAWRFAREKTNSTRREEVGVSLSRIESPLASTARVRRGERFETRRVGIGTHKTRFSLSLYLSIYLSRERPRARVVCFCGEMSLRCSFSRTSRSTFAFSDNALQVLRCPC